MDLFLDGVLIVLVGFLIVPLTYLAVVLGLGRSPGTNRLTARFPEAKFATCAVMCVTGIIVELWLLSTAHDSLKASKNYWFLVGGIVVGIVLAAGLNTHYRLFRSPFRHFFASRRDHRRPGR